LFKQPDVPNLVYAITHGVKMEITNEKLVEAAYKGILSRGPDPVGQANWATRLEKDGLETVLAGLIGSDEFFRRYLHRQVQAGGMDAAAKISGWLVHYQIGRVLHPPRLKMVQEVVPAGKKVLDLGGASAKPEGAFLEMGYPHAEDLTIIDLPLDVRMKPGPDISSEFQHNGTTVRYSYHSMADLSYYEDNSFDLVWSGQTFEHITEEEGAALFPQVKRVLKPGGVFALDTPNRTLTRLTVGDNMLIHAEHKIEYPYEDFIERFSNCGMELIDAKGILNMPETHRLGYGVLGDLEDADVNDSPETSYCFYVAYKKLL